MKCPVCNNVDLVMSSRDGVEIDYCPTCRGVWLDRGELDKIIERSSSNHSSATASSQSRKYDDTREYHQKKGSGYGEYHSGYHKKKKRGGFLGDLFDF